MNFEEPRLQRRPIFAMVLFAVSIFLFAMIPPSLGSYTSLGFDLEYERDQYVVEDFYRIRWPGDGSFRIGSGAIYYNPQEEDVDTIDLAFRFLDEPQYKLTASSWNRFELATNVPEGDRGEMKSSIWLILPSWLPGLLLLTCSQLLSWISRKRNAIRKPPVTEASHDE